MGKPKITKPQRLKKGDTIGIVAPASSFDIDNFKNGIKMLRKIGYKVKYERAIFNECWSRPGHDRQRGTQINRMFADKEVRAIFCAKAGYGSIETLPYLDKEVIRNNPKIFVGYSDITILLLDLQRIANMVIFHGPVVSDEIYDGMNQQTLEYLLGLICEPSAFKTLTFRQLISFEPGKATGILVGGNMSLIVGAINTPYDINTDNKILFLEDIGENLDVIKSYLISLKDAGKFKKVRGIIFGKMVDCFDEQRNIRAIVNEVSAKSRVPVLFGFPSGHTGKRGALHVTLPLGIPVTIDADNLTIKINEPAVQ
ncbi:MAG: LD-carboxypeptidase [Omnitrophica bacterium]|nr:LD-carboxypeptidase [Candidatus Omnitrophota bacterium]